MYRFREMVEMEGAAATAAASSNHPPPHQISDMFQKFAIAVKAKTYELFAEEETEPDAATLLLDSADEFITDQKVVVIKPDSAPGLKTTIAIPSLVPSLFATLSSFEASYLQFQAAHVPKIDETALEQADKSLVSALHKLTEMRNLYKRSSSSGGFNCDFEFPAGSFLEYQVQENQSKLRALETMVNSLQLQIDVKDDEVRLFRNRLDKIRVANSILTRKLGLRDGEKSTGVEVLLTIRVFEAMLGDSVKRLHCFTKLLIDLMSKAGWDLEEAAKSVHSGADYVKNGHFRYAFLSYASLGMFQNFDKNDFGLCDDVIMCNRNGSLHTENGLSDSDSDSSVYLKQLIDHVASNPMEILSKNPKSEFSRFCERKYDDLIHPTMESSIFSNLDKKDKVLDSWKSMTVFYDSFVRMASSIWLLHKLAYSFHPAVEIFQIEKGVEFSMVYMEDILGKGGLVGKTRPKVSFTVVPGFKIGQTVIQSQVYLNGIKST